MKNMNVFTDKKAELIIEDYLNKHKFQPRRINTKKLKSGIKSPDFCVEENRTTVFYCEVKNPMLLVNEETKMFHWTTSVSKIRRFIKRAGEQFNDTDRDHSKPWVIAFTSANFQFCWINFIDAYIGKVIRGKQLIADLSKEKYVLNSQEDINLIDAFIWCQVNADDKKIYQLTMIINKNSNFEKELKEILKKLKPSEQEKITDMNIKKDNYIITL